MRTHFTYAQALQASALSMLPNRPEFRKPLTAIRDELAAGMIQGTFTYYTVRPPQQKMLGLGDNSNTQYGQLGMWACEEAGLEVPSAFWDAADKHWRRTQAASGGWGYMNMLPNQRGTGNWDPSSA